VLGQIDEFSGETVNDDLDTAYIKASDEVDGNPRRPLKLSRLLDCLVVVFGFELLVKLLAYTGKHLIFSHASPLVENDWLDYHSFNGQSNMMLSTILLRPNFGLA